MNLGRIERRYAQFPVTVTLADGTPVQPAGVDVALLAPNGTPTADTAWTAATFTDGAARVLLAGPDAPLEDALTVPAAGGDLWARVVDTPEVDTARVERVTVS
jgi:hypothetical protein